MNSIYEIGILKLYFSKPIKIESLQCSRLYRLCPDGVELGDSTARVLIDEGVLQY